MRGLGRWKWWSERHVAASKAESRKPRAGLSASRFPLSAFRFCEREIDMNLFKKLQHALLGRAQPKVTRLEAADGGGLRVDELPPFTLKTAELMRYDPQVRIGLGARNGLLMAAEVEVSGADASVVRWVQHQWDALWHSAAHQLLRAKLYGDRKSVV